ncbi:MAG TPA: hypothetical protein VGG03_14555 [Thermoanaerobaculia bacterium]|jgi:hypothetical protein
MKRLSTLLIIAFAVLLAVPAFAANRTIVNGIDLWITKGNGRTFADFSKEVIPAGFFCSRSAPFTGKVVLRGVPIATGQPGVLGATDTIIQRLDNAAFNKRGVATTRIQMRAMQFESVAPVKTACGDFKLNVTLDGEQPITTMRIVRDNAKGGRFWAPIWVNVKLSFTPIGRVTTEALELRKALRFPPAPIAYWSALDRPAGPAEGFVKVDTDSDGAPDTFLPGISNFAAGQSPFPQKVASDVCHQEDEGVHCTSGFYYY